MHCDITTELNVNSSNVIAKIGDVVKKYAERKFRPGDFSRIIHITDTDGAFIPDEAVVEDAAAVKPLYSATEIRTQRKSGIENRKSHLRTAPDLSDAAVGTGRRRKNSRGGRQPNGARGQPGKLRGQSIKGLAKRKKMSSRE